VSLLQTSWTEAQAVRLGGACCIILQPACSKASFELRPTLIERVIDFIPVSRKRGGGHWPASVPDRLCCRRPGLLQTVWFLISGSLISHITPYCATHPVGTIPNKEHPAVVIDNYI